MSARESAGPLRRVHEGLTDGPRCSRAKNHVAENSANGCEILPTPLQDRPLVVHYSDIFVLAHGEQTIVEAMRQLDGDSHSRFVFAGGESVVANRDEKRRRAR